MVTTCTWLSGSRLFGLSRFGLGVSVWAFWSGCFGPAVSVWPFWSGRFGLAVSVGPFRSGRFGLAVLVWPFRSGRFGLAVSAWAFWSGCFGLAVSVWPFWSGRFGLAVSIWPFRSGRFGLAVSVWLFWSGRFGLADSVTGHFGCDISVHKELMKFVKFINVNEYLGRMIIYSYNSRQIKTRQFALPNVHLNSGAEMMKCSAIVISSKIPSKKKYITIWHFLSQSIRNVYYSATRNTLCVLIGVHKPGVLIQLF